MAQPYDDLHQLLDWEETEINAEVEAAADPETNVSPLASDPGIQARRADLRRRRAELEQWTARVDAASGEDRQH